MHTTIIPAVLAGFLAFLAGCNEAAPPANAEAATEAGSSAKPVGQPTQAAPQATSWAGKYGGNLDGGKGSLTITDAGAANRFAVEVVTTNKGGCGGGAKGIGAVTGNTMKLIVKEDWLPNGSCQMTVTRTGERLAVSNGTCPSMTGASCTLEGNYSRVGSASTATGAAPPPLAQWLVGAWAPKGSYCASGDPIRFARAGRYANSGGDIEGKWSLAGKIVTVTYAELASPGEGPLGPPETVRVPIERIGADDMQYGDTRMKRCPTRDGFEPWHPEVPFDTE